MDSNRAASGSAQIEYTDEAKRFLYRRRASTHATFFLSYLHSGMRLLDCGCGPGSITTDLANIVAPGEVIGLDYNPAQLELARAHAQRAGVTNVQFEQGDVSKLPYPDGSFDAVFVHGVIEYLSDPVQAYTEIRRVLKADGVLGSRHSDWGALMFAPYNADCQRFIDLFKQYMRYCGGEPDFGRHQLAAVRAAGFSRVAPSASCDCWTPNEETTRFVANFLATYCVSDEFARPVIQLGMTTEPELQAASIALRQWGEEPIAFAAEPWGEVVAWK